MALNLIRSDYHSVHLPLLTDIRLQLGRFMFEQQTQQYFSRHYCHILAAKHDPDTTETDKCKIKGAI